MPAFEFVVEGPPKTVNAKNKARYQAWIEKVRAAAQSEWLVGQEKAGGLSVTVLVTNYYRASPERPRPPDVDNVLKPVLDGMESVVYDNDNTVSQVASDRYNLAETINKPSPVIAAGIKRFSEFLYIRVFWNEESNDSIYPISAQSKSS